MTNRKHAIDFIREFQNSSDSSEFNESVDNLEKFADMIWTKAMDAAAEFVLGHANAENVGHIVRGIKAMKK